MARQNYSIPITFFSVALSLGLALDAGLPRSAKAESDPASLKIVRVTFDPPGDGKPTDTVGGASRGNPCPTGQANMGSCVTPLMPSTKVGLTVAERPTIFVYVPESSAKEIFFSLVDENKNHQYQTKIPITANGGVVSFTLPAEAPALEVGKNYQWSFIIIGEQGLRADSPGVQGEIRRVELNPSLKSQMEKVTPLERAALYGKEGIWLDTVGTLAEIVRSQPGDATLAANWQALLTSVGLDAIATKPLLK